jgi:hypothetical protein
VRVAAFTSAGSVDPAAEGRLMRMFGAKTVYALKNALGREIRGFAGAVFSG